MKTISIETALYDLLREYGISLEDLLTAIKLEDIDVYEELIRRIGIRSVDVVKLVNSLSWRLAALLLFVLQAFYIINTSGLYKGFLIEPSRDIVMDGLKVRLDGLMILVNRLKNLV